ncbi:MAG: hypothetical protein K2Q32_02345, partial [Alphaproteobacteria bacterium]|nr:hypothetical protein [Alphaproteobacteria bacterium]
YLKQKSYKRFFGGKGSNTVYAAAKMGAKVYFFGAFGSKQDIDSTEHIQHLQEGGVIVDVQRVEGETLSQAYVYANHDRQQVSMVYRGANRHADQSRIPDALLDEHTIALGQTSVPVAQTMAFFARAKARGATVVFNCTKVDDVTREHFDLVDELVVNLDEATNIAKKFGIMYGSPEALTAALAKELNVIAVVTRGGKSVLYAEREGSEVYVKQVPTPSIRPRDVTGAGDALLGSYVAFRARGRCVEQSLQLGVMAGAFTAKSESTTRPRLARAVRLANHIQRRKLAM